MFCNQCQEAFKNTGCVINGICGKTNDVANLQDLLIYVLKGISYLRHSSHVSVYAEESDTFVVKSLFMTITNANFNRQDFIKRIKEGIELKNRLLSELKKSGQSLGKDAPGCVEWNSTDDSTYDKFAETVGLLSIKNEDVRSLKSLVLFGIKGMAAYAHHAEMLEYKNSEIHSFFHKALSIIASDTEDIQLLFNLVLECGKYGVDVMSLLDKANTTTYGNPEITEVKIGVRKNPAILISGHDLRDLEELLEQTKGTGVDVYTHSEMLPAHYYPFFKKYDNLVGNYGNAWWKQKEEFEKFNGPVLFTTNCLVPPKESYKSRIYTTGATGFDGCVHIPDAPEGKPKDFSQIIEHAKKCSPPEEIETGTLVGGFAHDQVMKLSDKIIEAVKSGAIKKFYVMAGCDGRMKIREYYTDFAQKLPDDTVILTAGCAKYRYNKLGLGTIGGIPRVLDAGQCNDSYSLALIALNLKKAFNLSDINELPIVYNIAWYEQKAVIVLLALLYLGVKNIHLGPTLPAFVSPGIVKVLVEKFGISGINTADEDVKAFL